MPGDYSRNTFNPRRHYSAVLMQQGRVQLDADWNEQQAIAAWRERTEATELIGASGTPKSGNGFKLESDKTGEKLTIAAGHFYVEGLLCELDADKGKISYTAQPDHPHPEYTRFHPHSRTRELELGTGTYLAYLAAWEMEVSALTDARLRETALGGPDTALRARVVWQLRLARLATAPADCASSIPEWALLTAPTSGTLDARVKPSAEGTPCELPEAAGYTRLENQLYRIEIHTGGGSGVATFKWSRDNAIVETTIAAISGSELTVADLGKDEVLGFSPGQWVEIVDHESEVERSPHALFKIIEMDKAKRKIVLSGSASALAGKSALRLRRWDQLENADGEGVTTAKDWIALENGVEVSFAEGLYHSGDHWLIPARTISGQIEWPPRPGAANKPLGPDYRYAKLALIHVGMDGKIAHIDDCRARFPALTGIDADDVRYAPAPACGSAFAAVKTVKDALDAFCQRPECSLVLSPGEDLQARVDTLPVGADASICFRPGTYALPSALTFSGKGRLRITGAGTGTQLVAASAESALRFIRCAAVIVRDLSAESGTVASGNRINGTLDFEDCTQVEISSLTAKCAGGARRAAACVAVRHTVRPSKAKLHQPTLSVRGCDLIVGHRQIGLLAVNVINTGVEHNRIHAASRLAAELSFGELAKDRVYREGVIAGLIANAALGDKRVPANGVTNCTVRSGAQAVQFHTHPDLKKAWAEHLTAHPPTGIRTAQDLLVWMREQAAKMITEPALRTGAFSTWFDAVSRENATVLFQGVVVGGEVAEEVRVRDNTIEDALQGVHVGVSHRVSASEAAATRVDVAGVVQISGNTIEIALPMETSGDERHGIFVGNCASLSVEANRIKFLRAANAAKTAIDAIRIYGHIGTRVVIERNHLSDFPTGIRFTPRFPYPSQASVLWIIAENFAPGAANSHTVVVPQNANVELRLNRP